MRIADVILLAGGLDARFGQRHATRHGRRVHSHRRDQSLVPESPVGAQRSSRCVGNGISVRPPYFVTLRPLASSSLSLKGQLKVRSARQTWNGGLDQRHSETDAETGG